MLVKPYWRQQADADSTCALQARTTGLPPQGRQSSCNGSKRDMSSHGITWVMAEAVLAAAEQAATACVPVKRKKAAAEVVTGEMACTDLCSTATPVQLQ